jgi:hypothetical protein
MIKHARLVVPVAELFVGWKVKPVTLLALQTRKL